MNPFLPEALRLGNYSPLPPQQPHCLQAVTNNFIVSYNIINQILVSITLLFNASKIHLLKYHCLKYSRYYNMSMKSQLIKISQNIILSSNISLSKILSRNTTNHCVCLYACILSKKLLPPHFQKVFQSCPVGWALGNNNSPPYLPPAPREPN